MYSLYYGTDVNLNKSGCHIYAYAHAIQWLTSQPRNSSNGGELLSELIRVLNGESPESGYAETIFKNYVTSPNNNIGESVSTTFSESSLEALFDQGGVVISNCNGHYNLAVWMTRADFDNNGSQEAYVHIVDSSCQSTWYRLNSGYSYSSTGYAAYAYNNHSIITGYSRYQENGVYKYVTGTNGTNFGGGEYWVSFDAYMSAFQSRAAFKPKNTAPLSFDSYVIQETAEDDITVSVWLDNPNGLLISAIGMQCGTDKYKALEKEITNNIQWTRANLNYSASTYFGKLASGHTYYIRYYVVIDGIKYYSNWIEAATLKGDISFDTYDIVNLYESDARLSVWLDNPSAKQLSEIGVFFGKSREYTDTKVITTNVGWTRSNQSYYLSAFYGHYLESNTE